jgi:hypothetical protein
VRQADNDPAAMKRLIVDLVHSRVAGGFVWHFGEEESLELILFASADDCEFSYGAVFLEHLPQFFQVRFGAVRDVSDE